MMTERDEEIVATCELAVSHLTEHGRTRGSYFDRRGVGSKAACLAGAIILAHHRTGEQSDINSDMVSEGMECPAVAAVVQTIRERLGPKIMSEFHGESLIYWFNDYRDKTTDAEVIDVLNQTIKRHLGEDVNQTN